MKCFFNKIWRLIIFTDWLNKQNKKKLFFKKGDFATNFEYIYIAKDILIIVFNKDLNRVNYEIDINELNNKESLIKSLEKLKNFDWFNESMFNEMISKLSNKKETKLLITDDLKYSKNAS